MSAVQSHFMSQGFIRLHIRMSNSLFDFIGHIFPPFFKNLKLDCRIVLIHPNSNYFTAFCCRITRVLLWTSSWLRFYVQTVWGPFFADHFSIFALIWGFLILQLLAMEVSCLTHLPKLLTRSLVTGRKAENIFWTVFRSVSRGVTEIVENVVQMDFQILPLAELFDRGFCINILKC